MQNIQTDKTKTMKWCMFVGFYGGFCSGDSCLGSYSLLDSKFVLMFRRNICLCLQGDWIWFRWMLKLLGLEAESQYDWQEVSPSWCHPVIRSDDLSQTVNVSVVCSLSLSLSLYIFPEWLKGGNVLTVWEGCTDSGQLELWNGEEDVENH